MKLKLLVKRLQEYANLRLACDWDNVGLLVEPSGDLEIKKILVTNDLTEPVLEEAIDQNVNLIIAYHPAIVDPLKRLTQSEWKQRSIIKCIENRIAVYSPHTTWDSVNGGINDWLMEAFDTINIESATDTYDESNPTGFAKLLKIILPTELSHAKYFAQLKKIENIRLITQNEILGEGNTEFEYVTSPKGVPIFIALIKEHFDLEVLKSLRIINLDKPLMKNVGLGRIGHLKTQLKISQVITILKSYLNMNTLRLALANGKTQDDYVSSIAIGAGCCSDLLNNTSADLIISGEFLHHEILHETHRNVSVILTDHSNTERGYNQVFKQRFLQFLKTSDNIDTIEIIVSKSDRDPLEYV